MVDAGGPANDFARARAVMGRGVPTVALGVLLATAGWVPASSPREPATRTVATRGLSMELPAGWDGRGYEARRASWSPRLPTSPSSTRGMTTSPPRAWGRSLAAASSSSSSGGATRRRPTRRTSTSARPFRSLSGHSTSAASAAGSPPRRPRRGRHSSAVGCSRSSSSSGRRSRVPKRSRAPTRSWPGSRFRSAQRLRYESGFLRRALVERPSRRPRG
jgi:hypothetical protein